MYASKNWFSFFLFFFCSFSNEKNILFVDDIVSGIKKKKDDGGSGAIDEDAAFDGVEE
jgi:hypothetical protein